MTSILIEVTNDVEYEEKILIVDGAGNASAVSRLCRRADALLSLSLVRVESEYFRIQQSYDWCLPVYRDNYAVYENHFLQ